MAYNSKYTGAQVEELLDQIANGEVDNIYVTDFTVYDLQDVFYSEGEASKAADIASLWAAAQANKIIIVPISSEAKSGCIANLDVYDETIELWLYYYDIRMQLSLSTTSQEITFENVWMEGIQSTLISGENIRTINGEDIIGDGSNLELATKDELNAKADDSSVVHKEGDEVINGKKTFYEPVKFLHTGDGAITIGADTRVGVEGTTSTVLGLIRGTFFAGSSSYPLYLHGSNERPKYNFSNIELALLSDVNAKQDAIADLDAIRSGAEKGATALQSIPSEYVTETELTAKGYATTSALNDKVDKVSGKQLSTEDFTSALKSKLEGLSSYDDTALSNAISGLETRINTLVSGDASTAIESFNEIIAFLDGVQDTQDLAGIIASIEQQIAGKQDKITDLDTIRSGAAKGATALQSVPSEYITESELNAKSYATTSQLSGKQDTITDLATIRSGAALGATALQSETYKGTVTGVKINGTTKNPSSGVVDLGTVITSHQDISGKQDKLVSGTNIKTINNTSILGSGNISITGGSGTITGVSANGTSIATSGVANIPAASTSAYGVTKLSSSTSSTSTTLAATASAVKSAYDLAKGKQDKLTSGTNIKTINGISILGSGDITISGSGNSELVEAFTVSASQFQSREYPYVRLCLDRYGFFYEEENGGRIDFTYAGSGSKFLSDDGTYKTISSGGSGGGSGAYAEVNHGTSDTTFTLTPNTFHVWDEVASLTLTLGSETSGVANEFLFQFTSGSTPTSLTLPDDIKWANDSAPTIAKNMIYQISVLNGLATSLEFSGGNALGGPISFFVNDIEYTALEGMTWERFINSDYADKSLFEIRDGMAYYCYYKPDNEWQYIYDFENGVAYSNNIIIPNNNYRAD